MISRKLVVMLVIGVLFLVGIIGISLWAFSSRKPTPVPPCSCASWEKCVDGKCIPKTNCGEPIVPSGEHCSEASLICDESSGKWHCDGSAGCYPGYEGTHCSCNQSDRKIVNYCEGRIPICHEDGLYTYKQASTCAELNTFLEEAGVSLDGKCHDQCAENSCGNHGTCVCNDTLGSAQLSCLEYCSSAPDPALGECGMSIGNPTVSCPEFETCVCDVSTGYDWKCALVSNPSEPNQCPPDPPQKYCKDTSGHDMNLICMPCVYQGQEGAIKFCPGSNQVPFECLRSRYGLVKDIAPNVDSGTETTAWYVSQIETNLPVFPTVDNALCEAGLVSNTRLQSDLGIFYSAVGNPSGNVLVDQSGTKFMPFDANSYYYQSSNDPTIACFWTKHPQCSGNGSFRQFCHTKGQVCSPNDPLSERLKDGQCECREYISGFTGQSTQYVGCDCQFTDADCSNNGSVYTASDDCDTALCNCGHGTNGPNCQYTKTNSCGSHGTPNYDGTCSACDSGYAGNHCQFSRMGTCSNHGDPDSLGNCSCDSGWAGSNCSFNLSDPNTSWVATCYCDPQLDVCHSRDQNQDVNQRAQCAISASVNGQICAFGTDQTSSQNKCNSVCYSQGC